MEQLRKVYGLFMVAAAFVAYLTNLSMDLAMLLVIGMAFGMI